MHYYFYFWRCSLLSIPSACSDVGIRVVVIRGGRLVQLFDDGGPSTASSFRRLGVDVFYIALFIVERGFLEGDFHDWFRDMPQLDPAACVVGRGYRRNAGRTCQIRRGLAIEDEDSVLDGELLAPLQVRLDLGRLGAA